VQAERRLPHEFAGVGYAHRTVKPEEASQIDSRHELHREIKNALGFTRVDGPDDVRVVEALNDFDLTAKSHRSGGIASPPVRQHFEGDNLLRLFVDRLVNGTHAALSHAR